MITFKLIALIVAIVLVLIEAAWVVVLMIKRPHDTETQEAINNFISDTKEVLKDIEELEGDEDGTNR